MTYHNIKVIVSVIYRSPSQSNNEFDSFTSILEKLVSDINNRKPAYLYLQVTLMQDVSQRIPPLLVDNNFITDTKTRANIFNTFFAAQCTPLKNDSVLTINQMFLPQSRLDTLDFNEKEILKIIRALNIHKAHSHDDISIRMIQICDKILIKPLIILFQNVVKYSYYPDIWKRSNIIPVHKKVINN